MSDAQENELMGKFDKARNDLAEISKNMGMISHNHLAGIILTITWLDEVKAELEAILMADRRDPTIHDPY